jgi:hypothetical protein
MAKMPIKDNKAKHSCGMGRVHYYRWRITKLVPGTSPRGEVLSEDPILEELREKPGLYMMCVCPAHLYRITNIDYPVWCSG